LAEIERQLEEALSQGRESKETDSDIQRRYQMALDEIRELKGKQADLQQQLVKARSMTLSMQPAGYLNWEAEKQRILAALEADFDPEDRASQAERLKIEDVVRTTDGILAARDREIQVLNEQLEAALEDQGNARENPSEVAEISRLLDANTIIQEERERLQHLQEEAREKLRQAEIELALERARMARERAELEERAREIGRTHPPKSKEKEAQELADPANQGRWLARLGLTAADREPSRRRL
jgi:hypothetical protein